MLKIIIVDDEVFVRVGIKNTVDWKSIGYEVIGDADNGEKAIEICRKAKPDVVLTDIRMPKMDGLELMKILKQEFPRTKVVVLSCYNDMEIVREAMQFYGALDYIPKLSMQVDDLVATMKNVKKIIEEETNKESQIFELKMGKDSSRKDIEYFYNEIIDDSELNSCEISKKLNSLNTKILKKGKYVIACIKIDGYKKMFETKKSSERKQINLNVINTISELINNEKIGADYFSRTEEQFGVIISFDKQKTSQYIEEKTALFCKNLIKEIRDKSKVTISIGISCVFENFNTLRKIYFKASQTVEIRVYSGKESINFSRDLDKLTDKVKYDYSIEKILRETIEKCDVSAINNLINNFFDEILKDKTILPDKLYEQSLQIIYTFISVLKQFDGNIAQIKDEEGFEPFKSISFCDTLYEIKDWFGKFISEYFLYLKKCKQKKYGRDISNAIDYINKHYNEELMLLDVANYVAMNETYLSHLFKKETGFNFTDYLNKVRIDKAKEYLNQKDMSISIVSSKVGYSSDSYFSRVFKQLTGLSSLEYKKQKN